MCGWSSRPMAFISRSKRTMARWSSVRAARQDFQGDDAIEPVMHGLVDRAHAAAAEPFDRGGTRRVAWEATFPRSAESRWKRGQAPFPERPFGCFAKGACPLFAHDFRPGDRTAAFRLIQIRLGGRRSAKLADQRVFDVGKRGQLGLAIGARFHVVGQGIGGVVGQFADEVIEQGAAVRAFGGRHDVLLL